jgi:hypothetical protein
MVRHGFGHRRVSVVVGRLGRMPTGEVARTRPTIAALLDFEAAWPRHTADKGEAIRRELALTEARYYQLLLRAAASLEGQAHDAVTAHRVNRLASAPDRHAASAPSPGTLGPR